ncbi:transposase family protein, partial [Desulfogranum japonicum]|uniref:transposase family protein n=1 Tax=Desulfogranum japonicum TaxID=231447 RepID=UPI0003FB70DD
MKKQAKSLFVKHFSTLDDPRKDDQIKHNLLDILAIAICATICGADGWQAIEEYRLTK